MKPSSWREGIELARTVYARHAAGCCAHIILDDGNVEQTWADECLASARARGHADCLVLCDALARMSQTQRQRLYASKAWWVTAMTDNPAEAERRLYCITERLNRGG